LTARPRKGKRSPASRPPAERIGPIIERLKRRYPDARCALEHGNPLELLVATILSAQCTDVRVNLVTKVLFQKYRTAADYANADPAVFQEEIRSTGFFRNKTRSVIGMAQALVERHGDEVPRTMEELTALPGVGRKTANVVLGTAFGLNEGVVVDTHVHRITRRRLRLTRHDDPEKIERDLMKLVPRGEWTQFSHVLIHHGRQICDARKPKCEICPVNELCPSAGKV
jgi:endonuclease-3